MNDNESIGGNLDEHTHLGDIKKKKLITLLRIFVFAEMINSLDEVGGFEDSLMNELDADLMSIDTDSENNYIMQHMDIREPLSKLKKLIEQRLGLELPGFQFSLQGSLLVSKKVCSFCTLLFLTILFSWKATRIWLINAYKVKESCKLMYKYKRI